jgi:cytochrome c biogenesis protein CcdA
LSSVQEPAPLVYAFGLGLVAAVNPCGFPLLPAYLAVLVGDKRGPGALSRTGRALGAGASVTVGFVVVFGALGALVESGARLLLGWVPWAMLPVAAAMVLVGVLAAAGRPLRLRLPLPRLSSSEGLLGMGLFGVAYAVASLSCALPLFLAGVAGSFTRSGFVAGLGNFVAYALGMGLLLMVATLLVAHLGAGILRRAVPATRVVPRLSGVVLALVGAYLALYWVNDLVDPLGAPAPVRAVEGAGALVSNWLGRSPSLAGAALGAAVLVAIGGLAWASRRAVRRRGGFVATEGGEAGPT